MIRHVSNDVFSFVDIKRQRQIKDVRCPRCHEVGHVGMACPSVKCKECGEKGHMRRDCEAVLCYFCGEVGHQKAACPMVKRRKIQPSSSASGASERSSSTTARGEVTARSATAASSTSTTTHRGSRGVIRKVIHTASFASVASAAPTASVAKEETRSYGECVSDFLDNLRSQELFPPLTLMRSWRICAGGKRNLSCTWFVLESSLLLRESACFGTKAKLSAYEFAWVNL